MPRRSGAAGWCPRPCSSAWSRELLASAFRIALLRAESVRLELVARWHGPWGLAIALLLGAAGGGIAVWLVRRFSPEAGGSGIPYLKSVVRGERELHVRELLPTKFFSGLAGIGGGLALGREGPTIQMGGAAGLMVADWCGVAPGEGERRALMTAGAGAGLTAAFNAPLAGMVFVLEELQVGLTPTVFVSAFLACVAGDIVARALAGGVPVFPLGPMPAPDFTALPGALAVGLAAGFGGVLFNRSLIRTMDLFDRLAKWPPFWVGAATGAAMGAIGWLMPNLAGTGGGLVEEVLVGSVALGWVPALLAARFLMTVASYGSGPSGGNFIPVFVLGSLGGFCLGGGRPDPPSGLVRPSGNLHRPRHGGPVHGGRPGAADRACPHGSS